MEFKEVKPKWEKEGRGLPHEIFFPVAAVIALVSCIAVVLPTVGDLQNLNRAEARGIAVGGLIAIIATYVWGVGKLRRYQRLRRILEETVPQEEADKRLLELALATEALSRECGNLEKELKYLHEDDPVRQQVVNDYRRVKGLFKEYQSRFCDLCRSLQSEGHSVKKNKKGKFSFWCYIPSEKTEHQQGGIGMTMISTDEVVTSHPGGGSTTYDG